MSEKPMSLSELEQRVRTCHACPLADGRTQTVFGDGDPNARVVIIGEAPGKNEDLQGRPFVGAAGKYLNELGVSAFRARPGIYCKCIEVPSAFKQRSKA